MNNKRINQAYEALKNDATVECLIKSIELHTPNIKSLPKTIYITKINADDEEVRILIDFLEISKLYHVGIFKNGEHTHGFDLPNSIHVLKLFIKSIY